MNLFMSYSRALGTVAVLMILGGGKMAHAKEPIVFRAVGGLAASYIQSRNTATKYSSRILPHAGLSVLIPIEGGFALKTGIAYEQNGWKVHSSYTDTMDNIRNEYSSAIRLHTIHVPLQLCYTIARGKEFSYALSGGMSYGFFVKAEDTWIIDTYHKDRFLQTQTITWAPYIALIPDDSRLKSTFDGTAYFLFNTAFRAEASVTWKNRYSLQVFWERGLNEVSARTDNAGSLRLGYTGIALGFNLR